MTLYVLLERASAIATLPPDPVIRPVPVSQQGTLPIVTGNLMDPHLAITPAFQQAFQITVKGQGAVSASVQMYGSNDNKNWAKIGAPVNVAGTNVATAGTNGSVGYSFFGALLTAISGTNALATVTMNA